MTYYKRFYLQKRNTFCLFDSHLYRDLCINSTLSQRGRNRTQSAPSRLSLFAARCGVEWTQLSQNWLTKVLLRSGIMWMSCTEPYTQHVLDQNKSYCMGVEVNHASSSWMCLQDGIKDLEIEGLSAAPGPSKASKSISYDWVIQSNT